MAKRPDIGTKMYSVHENHYYVPGKAAPEKEYIVTEAEVREFFTGRFTEIKLISLSTQYREVYFYKLSDIGKRLFYTPAEAALLAKEMTEKYEKTWGETLRRTWEIYLDKEPLGGME